MFIKTKDVDCIVSNMFYDTYQSRYKKKDPYEDVKTFENHIIKNYNDRKYHSYLTEVPGEGVSMQQAFETYQTMVANYKDLREKVDAVASQLVELEPLAREFGINLEKFSIYGWDSSSLYC